MRLFLIIIPLTFAMVIVIFLLQVKRDAIDGRIAQAKTRIEPAGNKSDYNAANEATRRKMILKFVTDLDLSGIQAVGAINEPPSKIK